MPRKIIVHIAASADGFIARPDGDIDWLTNRPAPKGFYGIPKFTKTIDATIFGRKTYETGLKMGATFAIFIGSGIPLIAPRHFAIPLEVESVTQFPDGVVQTHYIVKRIE